jgi:hypothetical protein
MSNLVNRFKHEIKSLWQTKIFIKIIKIQIKCGMDFIQIFQGKILARLSTPAHSQNPIRNRAETLHFVVRELASKRNLLLLETGCMRADHGELSWGDDGCSTLLFGLLAQSTKGRCISVDISPRAVRHAKKYASKYNQLVIEDSVSFLSRFEHMNLVDLLYLDSFDFEAENPLPSQEHHLREIQVCFDRLKSGALVLVDDADTKFDGSFFGKATLVQEFFRQKGILPIIEDYQVLYQKP